VTAPHRREIACAILLDGRGRFLLQQRDDIPNIVAPGCIALFGGHREGDETFLECVAREVHEETGWYVPSERFEYLGSYGGTDFDRPAGTIEAKYYFVCDAPTESIVVTEGALLVVERSDLSGLLHRFAPSSRRAMNIFLEREVASRLP